VALFSYIHILIKFYLFFNGIIAIYYESIILLKDLDSLSENYVVSYLCSSILDIYNIKNQIWCYSSSYSPLDSL
jgi:hypothetical protein